MRIVETFDRFIAKSGVIKLNEYGSSGQSGKFNIKVNGKAISVDIITGIDTPDNILCELVVNLTPEVMLKAGIWSESVTTDEDCMAYLFSGSKTFSEKALDRECEGSVRNLDDNQIHSYFENKINAIKRDYTSAEFIKAIKKWKDYGLDANNYDDWVVMSSDMATQKAKEVKNKRSMERISEILSKLTPKEAMKIVKSKELDTVKSKELSKLTGLKGDKLFKYIEDAVLK